MPGLAASPAAQALVAARREREVHSSGGGRPGEIDLNRGHTGFVTPDHIREAACEAIRNGHTHYEDVKALRQAPPEQRAEALRHAESVLRRAASKGVISKKQASRRVSRLAKFAAASPS